MVLKQRCQLVHHSMTKLVGPPRIGTTTDGIEKTTDVLKSIKSVKLNRY